MIKFLRSFISRRRSQRELGRKGLVGSRKRRTQEDTFSNAAERSRTLAMLMLAVIWSVAVSILVFRKDEVRDYPLVQGQEAPATEYSELPVFYFEDMEATHARRNEAMAAVPLFYKISSFRISRSLDLSEKFFVLLAQRQQALKENRRWVNDGGNPASELLNGLSPAALSVLSQLVDNQEQRRNYLNHLTQALEGGVMAQRDKDSMKLGQNIRVVDAQGRVRKPKVLVEMNTPDKAAAVVAEEVVKYYANNDREEFRKALTGLARSLIGLDGNMVFDEELTRKERDKAAEAIPVVLVKYKQDQPLVVKRELVTARVLEVLRQYREQLRETRKKQVLWERLLRNGVICLLLMVVTGIYIYHIHPEVARSNQKIWVIGSSVIMAMLVNYGAVTLFEYLSPVLNMEPSFKRDLIPLALVSIVLSVTIGLRVAVYAGFFVAVIAAMSFGDSFDIVLKGMLTGCLCGFCVRYSGNYKSFFFRTVFSVFLTSMVLDMQIYNNFFFSRWAPVHAGIEALTTGFLALLMLFILEFVFNVSTNMALLMFCDYNHPLLKRLQMEAPGTFHHSLMVATLAEQAAMVIGANPIKCRVGALFHDIGKLIKPEYFAENSLVDDKHRELHPRMSTMIILNHVKEGVDLALKYKLKRVIRDAIQQHHGTDIVFYFYKRALEESSGKDSPVAEGEYRYPGPLPREKEVVLVSLADACEAASRSLYKPSPAKIDALVWELLRKRLRDGQLDNADMSIRDLARVRYSFAKTLTTMLHGRIAYPKDDDNDEADLFMEGRKVPAPESETDKTSG